MDRVLAKLFLGVLLGASTLTAEECCNCCGRFEAEAEYLYWQLKDEPKIIDLVTTGTIDNPNQSIVMGGDRVDNRWRSGGRLRLAYFCDEECPFGLEAIYFGLPDVHHHEKVSSSGEIGSSFLSVPFFNVVTSLPGTTPVSYAIGAEGGYSGTASLKTANRMQGAELNAILPLDCFSCVNVRLLGGFRYWNFTDKLSFDTSSRFLTNPDIFVTKDRFNAQNNFYGGQLGIGATGCFDALQVDLVGKVALGAMYTKATIDGYLKTTDFNSAGTIQTFSGGYFAQPSNIGKHHKTKFAVIPEADLKLCYHFCDQFFVSVGYSFLYVSNVLWSTKLPSNQINSTQSAAIAYTSTPALVGEAAPKAKLKTRSLWVQGVTVGLGIDF